MVDMANVFLSMLEMERNRNTTEIKVDLTEFNKLLEGLERRYISYTTRNLFGGKQVVVENDYYKWDAVCHTGSYGNESGLLEIMGSIVMVTDDEVEGWLTAEDILKRL